MYMILSLQLIIGSAEWIAKREDIYAKRNRRIKEVCNGYSDLYESPTQGKMFWFDLNNHLAICMHAKVKRSASACKCIPCDPLIGGVHNMEKKFTTSFKPEFKGKEVERHSN